ncbi:hypothetical protein ACJ2A9_09910 [Anaerobacillus sp. MEB173]|uniref:hypothetical protein n=1 Tax=Anaerobacillus sp. MEB173 TaxID=3383345 RepID=UPI003F913579
MDMSKQWKRRTSYCFLLFSIMFLLMIFLTGCINKDKTGRIEISSFQSYEGEIKKGKPHGYGSMYTVAVDGAPYLLYEGQFEEGAFAGSGTRYHPNGRIQYEGEWDDFVYHGNGKLFSEEGTLLYEGGFKYGFEYADKGKIYDYSGNLIYEGSFTDEQWHEGVDGLSIFLRLGHIDKIYKGDWDNGIPNGSGREYYRDGSIKYEGQFKNGEWHGTGVHYENDGSIIYEGIWIEGNPK